MKKKKKYLAILTAVAVCIGILGMHPMRVDAIQFHIVYTDITTQTDKVKVYVQPIRKRITLQVENQSEILFKKTYRKEGKKTITIPKQKAGTNMVYCWLRQKR